MSLEEIKSKYTVPEIQELAFMLRSKGRLQIYLALSSVEFKDLWEYFSKLGVKLPTDWIRIDADFNFFMDSIARYKSTKVCAQRYGVSESFFKKSMCDCFAEKVGKKGTGLMDFVAANKGIKRELSRLGSIAWFCNVYDIKPQELRELFIAQNLNINEYIDLTKAGNNEIAKGRKAELIYAQLNKLNIESDLNEIDGSKAEVDFILKDGIKVNVKSSSCHVTKGTTKTKRIRYWTFGMSGKIAADEFAFILYDKSFDTPLYWCVINTSKLPEKKSFTIRETEFEEYGVKEI